MKNTKKILVYNPYLNTVGGGEKHLFSILQIFEDEGYSIDVAWHEDIIDKIRTRFHLHLKNVKTNTTFLKSHFLQKLLLTKKYDYMFCITDGSYFFSLAKHNILFTMVPEKKLYEMTLINKLKLLNYSFITNSYFTRSFLKQWLPKEVQVIYPFVDEAYLKTKIDFEKKEKIILNVGRFFEHLHSKRQDVAIKAFKELQRKDKRFTEFKLILAGGLNKEDQNYFDLLVTLAGSNKNIIFLPNISYTELFDLYKKAYFYWHMTGYGIDDQKNPELVEHLGITPLEAMSLGCITCCNKSGGPKEIIVNNENGYLYSSSEELISEIISVYQDAEKETEIRKNAKETIENSFSYSIFKKNVLKQFSL